MRIDLQWTRSVGRDWLTVDSNAWQGLATAAKAQPPADRQPVRDGNGNVTGFTGTVLTIDDADGWIHRFNIMGDRFAADHLHIETLAGDVVRATLWNDDAGDRSADEMFAQVRTYRPDIISWSDVPSGDGVMAYNGPDVDVDMYISAAMKAAMEADGRLPLLTGSGNPATVFDFGAFVAPTADVIHGIWVTQTLHEELVAIPTAPWREWFP